MLRTTPSPWRDHALALLAYAVVAVLFVWPLPLHMTTHVTGPPTGDTGVYLWNMWVFQHELLDESRFPLSTSSILSLDSRADLSLHNYTVFANVLGLPLLRLLGLVASFNLVYIALTLMTAYACFLLAKEVAARGPEAWLAGLVMAWSPALVARGTGHFSLVAAAPLPLFVLLLLRAERTGARAYMIGAGLTAAWAAYCDPYYAVYCLVLALLHVGFRSVDWAHARVTPTSARRLAGRILNSLVGLAAAIAAAIAVTGGGVVTLAGVRVSATGLYTPVFALTVLVALRLLLAWGPSLRLAVPPDTRRLIRLAPWAALTGVVALAPLVASLLIRLVEGRFVAPRIFWRTSTPGVDLAAFVLPNPNHPLAPAAWLSWLSSLNGGFIENIASIPWVVMAVVACAAVLGRTVVSRYWLGVSLVAASLALGPFIRVAGIETYVPTPWSLLRYVPVIGGARAPARFTAIVMMGVAVLFALALVRLGRSRPAWRPALLVAVGMLTAVELWPAPRPLYSAVVPPIYDQIAADPRAGRVLELPFGIRDGLSSAGDFSASSQFYQSRHGKALIGGYLSRVSAQRVDQAMRRPLLHALILLSQGQSVPPDLAAAAAARAPAFARDTRLLYVVVDRSRATPDLEAFARRVLDLEAAGESGSRVLYRVRNDGVAIAGQTAGAVQ